MAITRYTTPTIPFEFELDLTNAHLWISFEQEDYMKLVKKVEIFTVDDGITSFDVTLTQEESAMFDQKKPIEIQLNYIFPDESRDASGIVRASSYKNLLDEVMHYAD